MTYNKKNTMLLKSFLSQINNDFPIPLNQKINIDDYLNKIFTNGEVIVAIENNEIVGLLTGYLNDLLNRKGYISILGIINEKSGLGLGTALLQKYISYAKEKNMEKIILNTDSSNTGAIKFYEKNGFIFNENYVDNNRVKKLRRESDTSMVYELEQRNLNILLTSVGRRSYLVNYFKKALGSKGKVHVSNSSSLTPAFHQADYSVVSPLIYEKNYISFLLEYCKQHNINAIIPLFDIDLPILSENKEVFLNEGIEVIVSDRRVIEICNDKVLTYDFLVNNNIKTPLTFTSISKVLKEINDKKLNYPLIIKPRWGMGSIGIYEANTEEELIILYNKTLSQIKATYLKYESENQLDESIIIQEKLAGQEYGLDIINDLDKNYINTVVKKKFAMRSGETDAAITEDNNALKELGLKLSHTLGHVANLDVDVFMVNDTPYVLEMNARFGGGYPFSHNANVDLPLAIVKWLNKEVVSEKILKEKIGVLTHKDISIVTIKE